MMREWSMYHCTAAIRLPKVYDDDPGTLLPPIVIVTSNGEQPYPVPKFCSWIFDDAYREPWKFGINAGFNHTIGDAISALTGFSVVHSRYGPPRPEDYLYESVDPERLRAIRPAYSSSYTTWYYQRDILRVATRRRCSECHQKAKSPNAYFADQHRRWHPHLPDCTKECAEIEASRKFARLHQREWNKWWEHRQASVCSPECHNKVARRYRRITLDLMEKRLWVSEGTKLLKEVESLLPGRNRTRKRSSNRPESRPLVISET